jgi:hypothetical protein
MKKEILEAILGELKKEADAYQAGFKTLDAAIDLDENTSIGIDDVSQKDQSTDIFDDMQPQAGILDDTISTVKSYQTVSRDEFSPGALVETDKMYLLVGVSLPPLLVNHKKVLGIAEGAKIYPSLKGKKKGDKLRIGNNDHPILSVS